MKYKEFKYYSDRFSKKTANLIKDVYKELEGRPEDDGMYAMGILAHLFADALCKTLQSLDLSGITDKTFRELNKKISPGKVRLLGFDSCVKKSPEEAEKAYESLKKQMRDMMEEGKNYEEK